MIPLKPGYIKVKSNRRLDDIEVGGMFEADE